MKNTIPSIPEDNIIAVHETTVALPIRYVLHDNSADFKISIFYDRWLPDSTRCSTSDVAVASWLPYRGISQISFYYSLIRDAGLEPVLKKFCERAYKAWQRAE